MRPETRYARSGEIGIAYQMTGEGDMDLVIAFPFLSHIDLLWDSPAMAHFVRRLGSFARVVLFLGHRELKGVADEWEIFSVAVSPLSAGTAV